VSAISTDNAWYRYRTITDENLTRDYRKKEENFLLVDRWEKEEREFLNNSNDKVLHIPIPASALCPSHFQPRPDKSPRQTTTEFTQQTWSKFDLLFSATNDNRKSISRARARARFRQYRYTINVERQRERTSYLVQVLRDSKDNTTDTTSFDWQPSALYATDRNRESLIY